MKFRDYITEQLFNIDSADKIARELESNIKAPFVKAQKSTLGGNVSVIMRLSLDPKNEWYNNIFENSRFIRSEQRKMFGL